MKFSLVLATLGRSVEVEAFFRSLNAQTHRDIQLIVVDQNDDERVERLLSILDRDFEVLHLRSRPGLSRARNLGLGRANGDVIAFPDDDCWYAPTLLWEVAEQFGKDGSVDGLTGRSVTANFAESGGSFAKSAGPVDLYTVWSQAISYTIFLRRRVCQTISGGFDETLGVGANTRFGSGEETDYLIRALQQGRRLWYLPSLTVFHPDKTVRLDTQMINKARSYGSGMGRVLAKHRYPWRFRAVVLARPLAGSVFALLQLRFSLSRFRWSTALGRLQGMFGD